MSRGFAAWAIIKTGVSGGETDRAVRELKIADVVFASGKPALASVRTVLTPADAPDGYSFEAQDFFPGDGGLTIPCYSLKPGEPLTRITSIDFATRKITLYAKPADIHGEIGIFPDGRRAMVECAGKMPKGLGLCVVQPDPANPVMTRITHMLDYGDWSFSYPVVSKDGRQDLGRPGFRQAKRALDPIGQIRKYRLTRG